MAIDCNVGQNRTGLGTPGEVTALAQVIARHKGLELVGLQGYGGNNQHVKGFANRRARAIQSNERVVAARRVSSNTSGRSKDAGVRINGRAAAWD